jgi:3-deoxy-D-manno-octulosonic-acid transferase
MSMIIHFVYSFVLFAGLFVYGPFYIRRMRKGSHYRPDLFKRFGFVLPKPRPKKGFRILIHAVSVGETRAVIPVVKELKARIRDLEIYLTTTTGTGQKTAEQIGKDLDRILYFPIDFGFISAAFLRRIRPDCICLTETEIWPNFVQTASKYKIPLVLINGRISDSCVCNRIWMPEESSPLVLNTIR